MKGIDCATPITTITAKALAAAGMGFVCRYLVPDKPSYKWKRLTKKEAEIITAAGMLVVSVFETTANRPAGGAAAGKEDGLLALKEALAVGQPKGTTVYFAVDYDARQEDYSAIEEYLRAADDILDGYEVGVYGSFAIVEEMARRGVVKHFWQTYAWSRGQKCSCANIYQYKNDQPLAGIQVDFNESYGDEGWWSTKTEEVIPALFKDIVNHWAKGDIEWLAERGLVAKTENFRPNDTITRAETAVLIKRTIEYVIQEVPSKTS
ncbi:glycoside hydrolase domain-containing protein [Desulfoscipio gibsoniae]